MQLQKNQTLNVMSISMQEMRYGLNGISLPFLEKNELGNYLRQYPEFKEIGFEGCKKKISSGIEHILKQTQKNTKCLIHPFQSRSRYVDLQKWLITHLHSIQQPQYFTQLSTLQYIQQQKKLIISTYLQLQNLFSSECKQKSQILKLITCTSLQIINTLLIELQNTSANMLIGYMKEKNSSEKELIERISSLEKTIEILENEKNNKWKNLYIVVKDNRVMKKQNHKLIKMLNSQQEKVRLLNEQHLRTKDQNEKFKLFLSSDKQEQNQKLSRYVQAKVQIDQIDRLIKLYPKQAQKIAYAQLKNIENSQLDTLEEKIVHIINAIQKSGEIEHQNDEGDDFLDTNKAKMCFNISVQTDKLTQEFGTNTYNKVLFSKHTQVCSSLKYNHLIFVAQNVSEQVRTVPKQQNRTLQKKKTKLSMANIKNSIHKQSQQQSARQGSIKDIMSTKKVRWAGDFQIVRTINFRYLPECFQHPIIRKQPQLLRRRESLSSSSSSSSERSDNKTKQNRIRSENLPNQKKNRENFDSNLKVNQCRLKAKRSKQKRFARFQNLHTFSLKSKTKDFRHLESELWKISKTYNLSIKEQSKFCQNVFVSTPDDRNKMKNATIMMGYGGNGQKYFMTTFPGRLKTNNEDNYENQTQIIEGMLKQEETMTKNKKTQEFKVPEEVNKKIYRASRQKNINMSLEMKKNLSKPSNVSNEQKIPQKRSVPKNAIIKMISKKRERKQSQESLPSVSTLNSPSDNRFSFQQDLPHDMQKNEQILRVIGNEEIIKRSSQFSRPGFNNNVLKAKKYNRQASSVLLNRFKNPNIRLVTQMGPKRDSQSSHGSLVQNSKHGRTKTEGIDKIDEMVEEQMTTTFKNLRDSLDHMKIPPIIHKISEVQNEFEENFKPRNRFCLTTLSDMQRIQQIDSYKYEGEEETSSIDLVKSIEKLIKNIAQRSVEIIKKEYLFKEFLLSFYQLQYGNGKENIPKSYVQFLKELKKARYSSNPMVQCLYLLMNENCSEVYRREIFKLFTVLIDKNGRSLTDYAGEHQFYKKIITELLEIFIDPTEVHSIVNPMCLQQLNGSLSDYFIAVEGEIRKRSINSQLYTFMVQNVLQYGETTVSFDIIKEIAFFMTQGNKRVKNQLIQLRMYSEPFIQLHRLCLIVDRLKFTEFMQIGSIVEKKYNEFKKATGSDMSSNSMVNSLAKQKFVNFPYLKHILHRKIQCFYKYNSKISQPLLKLCQVNLFSQKLQNESPISDCLKVINEQTQKLQRLRYYKQVLENTSK